MKAKALIVVMSLLLAVGTGSETIGIAAWGKSVRAGVRAMPEIKQESLVGQWRSQDDLFTIVYLPDGRTASWDNHSATPATVRLETGTYRVEGDRIKYEWMLTEPQEEQFQLDGDTLIVGAPKSPVRVRMRRIGAADKAAATYEQIYQKIRDVAELSFAEVTVGSVKPGYLSAIGIKPDKSSGDVVPAATVYTKETRFQWVLTPPHYYKKRELNEPGFTCCSYTFLPNGRFYFDGWWYGILMDDRLPFNENNTAEVRGREVPVRHTQFWGKYRVMPGKDALSGDTVEMVYSDGSRTTVQVKDGRRYLVLPKPRMLFNNWSQVNQHRQ